jgi:hypothetical protein
MAAGKALHWEAVMASRLPIAAMLGQVHEVFNPAIARVPEQWLGWGNLLYRWTAWHAEAIAMRRMAVV